MDTRFGCSPGRWILSIGKDEEIIVGSYRAGGTRGLKTPLRLFR